MRLRAALLLAALVAAALETGCSCPAPRATWSKTGDADLAFVVSGSCRPFFLATVAAGRCARIMLAIPDSGAEVAAIPDHLADRLDLDRCGLPGFVHGHTIGVQLAFPRRVPHLAFGDGTIDDFAAVAVELRTPVCVLPLAAFPGRALVLDFARRRIAFVTAARARELARGEGSIRLPTRREGALLFVTVGVVTNGRLTGTELELDTGEDFTWLPGGESFDPRAVSAVDLRGVRVPTEQPRAHADVGLLGCDVLAASGRRVLVDLEGEQVVLLAPERK